MTPDTEYLAFFLQIMSTIRNPSHAARHFVSHWFSDIPSDYTDDSATCSLLRKCSEAIHEGFTSFQMCFLELNPCFAMFC
jgi:hypothetical protein